MTSFAVPRDGSPRRPSAEASLPATGAAGLAWAWAWAWGGARRPRPSGAERGSPRIRIFIGFPKVSMLFLGLL